MKSPKGELREESLIITPDQLNIRLDKLLVQTFPAHSRTYFQYLITSGLVLVNGFPVKKRESMQVGDEIDVCFELTPELSLEAENIPLDILYEDDYLIAINKPAGMVTHPAPGHPSRTFVNALLYHCKSLPQEEGNLRPGIVHRLDKETSGILLAAKKVDVHQRLVEMFSHRSITKHYLGICIGNPGSCTIHAPLKRHPKRRQEMHVDKAGKAATSVCTVLEEKGIFTWVNVELITGRTHQIRAHLKHIGTPLLGDPVYGRVAVNSQYDVKRQMLHAHTLIFAHPITSAPLQITAPLPPDMEQFARQFKRDSLYL